MLRRIYRLAKPYRNCPVVVQSRCKHQALFFPALVSDCSLLHKEELSERFRALSLFLSEFQSWPRLRVVGSCIRSVVVILPVGSITPVGIRNFYIPGNPGSPDSPSALRLCASSGFGSVNSSVSRFVFLPCAALRRSWEFHIQLPCGFCLLRPCIQSIIGSLLMRESQLFYLPGFAT